MYYAILNQREKTIQLIPNYYLKTRFRKRIPNIEKLDNNEIVLRLLFNGVFIIPLSQLSLSRTPFELTISNGKNQYKTLNEAVNAIYKARTYTKSEESAKEGITKLLIKALTNKTKLYGLSWVFEFSFKDALDYEVLL